MFIQLLQIPGKGCHEWFISHWNRQCLINNNLCCSFPCVSPTKNSKLVTPLRNSSGSGTRESRKKLMQQGSRQTKTEWWRTSTKIHLRQSYVYNMPVLEWLTDEVILSQHLLCLSVESGFPPSFYSNFFRLLSHHFYLLKPSFVTLRPHDIRILSGFN